MRLSTDVNSTCQEQKDFFWNRFSEIRKLLNQPGSRLIDNFSLLGTLFDLVSESLCLNLTLLPLPLSHTQPPFLTLLPLSLSQPSLFCPIVVSLVDVAEKMKQTIAFVYRRIHRFSFLQRRGTVCSRKSLFLSTDWGTCFTLSLCCEKPWKVESPTKVLYLFILVLLTQ